MAEQERRSSYIDLHERLTAQETLMTVVRDDVVEIKTAIVGNGQPGLSERVSDLETMHTVAKSWMRGIAWIIGLILTAVGAWAAWPRH